MHSSQSHEFSLLLLADLKLALQKGDLEFAKEILSHLHPADIADTLEELEDSDLVQVFSLLPLEKQVEVFEYLEEEEQEKLVERLPKEILIPVIENMSADERADFFKALPKEEQGKLLKSLSEGERRDVKFLTSYPEETAGSVMTTEFVAIPADYTVEEALELIRREAPHKETVYYLYVVDDKGHLLGHVSLRDLVLAQANQKVKEIMNPHVIAVGVMDDQEKVAKVIQKYDFLAVPVVDEENRLLGIVTHDDVMDVMESENTEDIQKMGAVSPLEDEYLQTPFVTVVRKRVVWLSILFLAEMLTSTVLSHYEHVLEKYLLLVFFIPLIVSAGGNTGSQSSTLVVRGLSVGNIQLRDWWRILLREFAIGLAMGLVLGGIGFVRAYMLGATWLASLVIFLAVVLVVILGACIGSLLPLGFHAIGIDPAVTSSPFVASLVDVLGILAYLWVAQLILGL